MNPTSLGFVEALIKEFLLFRGLTQTYHTFEAELKSDKLKGLQVARLVDQLFSNVSSFDHEQLFSLWYSLNDVFFSNLREEHSETIIRLESSLKRYYLVSATNRGRLDKAREFLEAHSHLSSDPSWSSWFALPFCKNPSTDPQFELFFSREWFDSFSASLYNFLSVVVSELPLPQILLFDEARLRIVRLEGELERLKEQLASVAKSKKET